MSVSMPPALNSEGTARNYLFRDQQKAMAKAAEVERGLLEPRTGLMDPPSAKTRKARIATKKSARPKASGFGAGSVPPPTAAQQANAMLHDTVLADGVCRVDGVLRHDSTSDLYDCVADELSKAYDAVAADPSTCVSRFNVPIDTLDPLRGYLLLPLRDEKSVASGDANGPMVRCLRELLASGSKLGELFESTCGKANAELYDVVALRTEPGASRQCIHFDTPFQKTPGLYCAFIALHDVRYSMGTTVFLPGTHLNTGERKAFVDGSYDGRRNEMLASATSRYALLKAGDAVFFDMRTLHAGTANLLADEGGGQRLLFVLTFRNRKAKKDLGHLPNLRPHYRDRGITLAEMRSQLADESAPFAGEASDGFAYGDGLTKRAQGSP
jgi:hypothetical protein